MARVTTYSDYNALTAATAAGDAAVIAAVQAMRLAYRDRCAEAGTKLVLDFKSAYCQNGSPVPATGRTWRNQLPAQGECTQLSSVFGAVNNSAGQLIGLSRSNGVSMGLQFPNAARLPANVTRCGWLVWITMNSMTASGTRMLAGWGDGTLGSQRAFDLQLLGDNRLQIGGRGSGFSITPVVGTTYQMGVEYVFNGTNSIIRGFLNGAQLSTDVTFDGTAGLNQPVAAFGIGGMTGYFSTANCNYTIHRSIVDDLTASGRTMLQLVNLDWRRNQQRFAA